MDEIGNRQIGEGAGRCFHTFAEVPKEFSIMLPVSAAAIRPAAK